MQKDPAEAHTVAVVIGDGFAVFEFATACEVFGVDRSELHDPWYQMVTCAPRPGLVQSQLGFSVEVPRGLDALRFADTVVVAPVKDGGKPPADLVEALRAAHRRGARLVSICTGAFVLAAAGLLDGRCATTHWVDAPLLASTFPEVKVDSNVLYVDSGDRIFTSAGSAAGVDLCLHLVREDLGAEVANAVARRMVVPPHRDGGQAQFVDMPLPRLPPGDPFSATLEWAQAHLGQSLTVEDLARRAAMSPRTFARRFHATTGTTPIRWLIRQRVMLAQRLLETTDLSVDDVAGRVGMGTATNLRIHFQRATKASPAAYRRTFRRSSA